MINLITFLIFISSYSSPYQLNGEAFDLKSNILLYTEKHKITEYLSPKGDIFAKMDTDFKKDILIPDVIFTDQRFSIFKSQVYDKSKQSSQEVIIKDSELPN